MQNIARGTDPNGFPMLLVAVNLLMLCLFVLLNSLATPPTVDQKKHRQKILAEVQEGYDVVAAEVAEDGTTPTVATTPWAVDMADKLQGVVVNRLRMSAAQMEADATRVIMTLPLENLFAEKQLVGAELVRSLMLAAQGSQLVWTLHAPEENLMDWAPELAAITGQVNLVSEGAPGLKLVVKPGDNVTPSVGRGLQSMGESQGATVQGEGAAQ
jgi:hypothetical protein